jgi:hypothetical protein
MKRELCIVVICLLNASHAIAEEWESIIKDDDHEVLVDIDSYNVTDNLPYLIAKTIYENPQQFNIPNKKITYTTSIATFQFNCVDPLYRIRSIQLLDKEGKLVETVKISGGLQKINPNTDEFSIGQLTCSVHQMLGDTAPPNPEKSK